MEGIDKQLQTAATMARGMVPDDYHDRITGPQSMTDADYQILVGRYNRLCESLGLEYLWSLMVIDNRIVFTTSTSPDKNAANRKHAAFFETHSNPELYRPTFARMTPTYQVSNDKWGRIRVALLPFKDGLGRPYLFGASVRLTEVERQLRHTVFHCLFGGLLLFAAGVAASVMLARSLASPLNRLTVSISKIAEGNSGLIAEEQGSFEQRMLAASVNRLNSTLQEKIVELARQEERQRITLNSLGDAVIATDTECAITGINPMAEHLTGWTSDKALGKPLPEVFRIVNAMTRQSEECPVDKVLRLGQVVGLANHTVLLSRDGREYQIADSAAPIRDPSGQSVGVVLVFHDVTEQYRMQEALRENTTMLKQVLDTVPQAIFWKDKTSVYLGCNAVFARAVGLADPDRIVGKTDFDLPWHREEAEAYRADDAQVIAGRTPKQHIIERLLQSDGTWLWIDTSKMPLLDSQSQVRGVLGVYEDITERKQAAAALKESEEKHRLAMEATTDGLWDWIITTGTVDYSSAWKGILGMHNVEPSYQVWESRIHPDDRQTVLAGLQAHLEGKTPQWSQEHRLQMEDGAWKWVLGRGRVVARDAAGCPCRMIGTMTDISERKKAESDYRMLFREMLDGFALHEIICDQQGNPTDYRFLAVNPAFEQMTGLNAGMIEGRTVLEVMPGIERHWIVTYGKVALTGEPALFENYSNDLKKHFAVTAFRPAPNQFACIFADITERKMLEEQLRQAQKLESIGQLAGGVAHDFNNILAATMMQLSFLEENPSLDMETRKSLKELMSNTKRAANLTRQLLIFGRRSAMELELLDVNELVTDFLKMLGRLIGEHIAIRYDPHEALPAVEADAVMLEQVLMNLSVNARDAMPHGGRLTIAIESLQFDESCSQNGVKARSGPFICLSVSDTGLRHGFSHSQAYLRTVLYHQGNRQGHRPGTGDCAWNRGTT